MYVHNSRHFSEPSLQGWAFFENAGGSYPCKQFVDRLTEFYLKNKVQPYYPYPASIRAGEMMDASYRRMAEYLNVDASEIHFGPSTTQNVYVLANAMRPMWQDGDEIIVSCQDHEANAGAWRRLADRGMKVVEWHVDKETGLLDLEDLGRLVFEPDQDGGLSPLLQCDRPYEPRDRNQSNERMPMGRSVSWTGWPLPRMVSLI